MTCQHHKSKVVETRRVGLNTYRRRCCVACEAIFVTEESRTTRMPRETNGPHREKTRQALREAQQNEMPKRFDGSALTSVWK